MFETRTKAKLLHVPLQRRRAGGERHAGGRVDAMFAVMPEAIPHVQAGKLHALAVMSPQRSPALPNVPTMAESGFADLEPLGGIGLFAPRRHRARSSTSSIAPCRPRWMLEMKAKLAENGMGKSRRVRRKSCNRW